jgi:hypothetical protein
MGQYLHGILGPREAGAATLPPGAGPASTTPGAAYPTPPTTDPGSTIMRQRLDPTTVMLSNQPPAPTPPPDPAAVEALDSQRYTAPPEPEGGVQAATAPMPRTPRELYMDQGEIANQDREWRKNFRQLDRYIRSGSPEDPGPNYARSFGLLGDLVNQGAISIDPTTRDVRTAIPGLTRPGWNDRLNALVADWLDYQDSIRPTGGPSFGGPMSWTTAEGMHYTPGAPPTTLPPSQGYHPQFWSGLRQPSPESQNLLIPR